MNNITSWQGAIVSSWNEVWSSFARILPNILGAILIFVVGVLIAYWVKRLILQLLDWAKLNDLAKNAGVQKFLTRADVKLTPSEIVAVIVEWVVLLIFFLAAVDVLGLQAVSGVVQSVLGYIPNVLAAALIFTVGFVVANVVETLVRGAVVAIDATIARQVGRLARWVILLAVFFASIDQLKIAQNLVSTFYQGLTYTIVLVVGLSVGLGAKDLVAKILNDWYQKISK